MKGYAMKTLVTTLGNLCSEDVGWILPHEHVFTDLRNEKASGFAVADVAEVLRLMGPELEAARTSGISVLVECTPTGVGRRADILSAVSAATRFPLLVPTGVYREPWMPGWVKSATMERLQEWMTGELTGEIEKSGVKAGWIKLSAGNEGMTADEVNVLQAAAAAAAATGAVIGSHTIRGEVVRAQLDVLDQNRLAADRFIWIHAQAEPDFALNVEMARRGAWIEYDNIGTPEHDDLCADRILRMLDLGFQDQLLVSQDRGWFDPAKPGGGTPKPYTYIVERFIPGLLEAGATKLVIEKLMHDNPFRAFSR
jgi:phosphotriesterase-related protein